MKWVKLGFVSVLVIAAIIVFSAKVFQKKQTYYYYPEWNAYYDVQHKNYIYSIDGGKTWDTITNSSNTVASTLGEKIQLRSSSAEIWRDNAEHRTKYGGELNDLVGIFLQSGEDKRVKKKKNSTAENNKTEKFKPDSINTDSVNEIEQWVHETTIQENTAIDKKGDGNIEPSIEKTENIIIPVNDSTGLQH
jgi:hypothetical protein